MRLRTLLGAVALAIPVAAAAPTAVAKPPAKGRYVVHALTSDQTGVADNQDPNLVNAWGLAARVQGRERYYALMFDRTEGGRVRLA